MLSRVADSLYWMSRYLERAEHTARLLAVKLETTAEQSREDAEAAWARVFPRDDPLDALPHGVGIGEQLQLRQLALCRRDPK